MEVGFGIYNLKSFRFLVDLYEIIVIYFGLQILKIIALIEQWKRRILTPIGRATVN